jgi:hypothetical protein
MRSITPIYSKKGAANYTMNIIKHDSDPYEFLMQRGSYLATDALAPPLYGDIFEVTGKRLNNMGVHEITKTIFKEPTDLTSSTLVSIQKTLSAVFPGLDGDVKEIASMRSTATGDLKVGDILWIYTVFSVKSEGSLDEIVLFIESPILKAKFPVIKHNESLYLVTVVKPINRKGLAYWKLVKPFHQVYMKSMIMNLERQN